MQGLTPEVRPMNLRYQKITGPKPRKLEKHPEPTAASAFITSSRMQTAIDQRFPSYESDVLAFLLTPGSARFIFHSSGSGSGPLFDK